MTQEAAGERVSGATRRRRPAAESSRPPSLDELARDNEFVDSLQIFMKNRGSKRSFGVGLRLLRQAFATVWHAGRWPFVAVSALTVIGSLAAMAQVLVINSLLDRLLHHGNQVSVGPLVPYVALLAALGAVALVVTSTTQQIQRYLGQVIARHTSRQVLDVTTGLPLDAYETPWFFNYVIRVDSNSLTKPLELTQAVVNILAGVTTAVGLGAVVIAIEPLLVPLLLVTALPAYALNRVGSRLEFKFAVNQAAGIRERTYIGNILKNRDPAKEVRAFELAPMLRSRWEGRYTEFVAGMRSLVVRRIGLNATGAIITALLMTVSMLFLLWRVSTGDIRLAQAGAALVALRMLGSRMQTTSGGANTLFETRLFLEDLDQFLQLRSAFGVAEETPATSVEPQRRGFDRLSVDDVSFRYPGSQALALDGISLDIGRGEVVALVGENGSGKTTLAKLLAGLHQPTSGHVRWDGDDAAELDPTWLRRQIAVIFQDFVRYEVTAWENIAFGRAFDPVDHDAVRQAAEQAGAAGFLDRLPAGLDTPLSKALRGGVDLSLGQWQRVALARAFYRNANFVVLDEPTSALDPRAEQALFERIRELLAGRTVLLISHRFSSVRSADRIFVLDQGRVAETGSHDELMALGGIYQELFTMQAAAYLDER